MSPTSIKKNSRMPAEIINIDASVDEVVCDGGGGPLGHPQVWYNFDGKNTACCHYCGRKFIKTAV